jgi:hypothetical protein
LHENLRKKTRLLWLVVRRDHKSKFYFLYLVFLFFEAKVFHAGQVDEGGEGGEDNGGPDGDVAEPDSPGFVLAVGGVDDAGADGEALEEHFEFAGPGGAEFFALRFAKAADDGDKDFAGEDESYHPPGNEGDFAAVPGEHDEAAAGEDFIDEGIEAAAELAGNIPSASEGTVDNIGEAADDKEDKGPVELLYLPSHYFVIMQIITTSQD